MLESGLPAPPFDDEPTVIPLLVPDDRREFDEGGKREGLHELLADGGDGRGHFGCEDSDIVVASVPKLRHQQLEVFIGRVDGQPSVLGEIVGIDGPVLEHIPYLGGPQGGFHVSNGRDRQGGPDLGDKIHTL